MKQRDMGIGIGLVVLGLIFLIGPALNLQAFGWPFFVIIPGVILLFIAFTTNVGNGSLAVPGSIVTVTGLILLVLNLTGRMDAWAYAWALVMAGAGVGTHLYGRISDSATLQKTGTRGALAGLALFVLFGLIFELFIFGTFSTVLRWAIPIALLLAGAYILYRGSNKTTQGPTAPPPAPHQAAPHPQSATHPQVPPPTTHAPLPRAEPGESEQR
ncbi:MAG: hypothetical protein WDA15_02745 [Trueperaceae bacterium]|jgi:hypothetical protein